MRVIIKRTIEREIFNLTGSEEYIEYVEFLKQLKRFLSVIEINFDNYATIINDFKCSLSDSNNEEKLNEYTKIIIREIESSRYSVFKNYEFTKKRLYDTFEFGDELGKLAHILLDYLEIEKEKILKEIRDNKK